MSRIISEEIQEQLESSELFPFYLFQFEDANGVIWKYTTLDVSQNFTTYGSDGPSGTYEPLGFEFERITYSQANVVDDASIRIDNLDQVQTALWVGDVLQGNTAALFIGVLSPSGTDLGTLKIFEGEIDQWSLDEENLIVTVGSLFNKWDAQTTEQHSASCRWKVFGGTECTYAGAATWCDRSYSRCASLQNTDNFGGFRHLPEVENKQLWWGPTPKQREKEG
jgi:hypothetical protein